MGRAGLVSSIEGLVAPHLRASGYRRVIDPSKGIFGGTRALLLWAPDEPIILDGFALTDVLAITEDGVMEDATGGGCVTGAWDCYPVEDLQMLLAELRKRLPATPKGPAQ
jgi:hypothetical protein